MSRANAWSDPPTSNEYTIAVLVNAPDLKL